MNDTTDTTTQAEPIPHLEAMERGDVEGAQKLLDGSNEQLGITADEPQTQEGEAPPLPPQEAATKLSDPFLQRSSPSCRASRAVRS